MRLFWILRTAESVRGGTFGLRQSSAAPSTTSRIQTETFELRRQCLKCNATLGEITDHSVDLWGTIDPEQLELLK
jgi:hypothetical protein